MVVDMVKEEEQKKIKNKKNLIEYTEKQLHLLQQQLQGNNINHKHHKKEPVDQDHLVLQQVLVMEEIIQNHLNHPQVLVVQGRLADVLYNKKRGAFLLPFLSINH